MDGRQVVVALAGLATVVAGLAVGLSTVDLCGSPFLPAAVVSPSQEFCAPMLDSPRLLAESLIALGLVVVLVAVAWGAAHWRHERRLCVPSAGGR